MTVKITLKGSVAANYNTCGYEISVEKETKEEALNEAYYIEIGQNNRLLAFLMAQKRAVEGSIINDGSEATDTIVMKPKVQAAKVTAVRGKQRYSIAKNTCKTCKQLISWDFTKHDTSNPGSNRNFPWHVDENGYVIGDGSCGSY